MTQPASKVSGRGRFLTIAVMSLVVLIAIAVARLMIGPVGPMAWPEGNILQSVWRLLVADWLFGAEPVSTIDIRVLRILLAICVGVALAISGVSLQTLLRNPLAEPFILGLSTGAGVGIVAMELLQQQTDLPIMTGYVGALVGCGISTAVVYAASRRHGLIDPLALLLAGVVLSTLGGSVIMLLNYLFAEGDLNTSVGRWMMGGLDESIRGDPTLVIALGVIVLLTGWMIWRSDALDVMTLNEDEATSLGVDVAAMRRKLFLIATVLAAVAVTLGGPIAFVGLVAPHLARLLLGPKHRSLLVVAGLIGACLILASDLSIAMISRAFETGQMPLGVMTAMIGGPFFLVMLRREVGR